MNQSGANENSKFVRLNFFNPAEPFPARFISWLKRMRQSAIR